MNGEKVTPMMWSVLLEKVREYVPNRVLEEEWRGIIMAIFWLKSILFKTQRNRFSFLSPLHVRPI